MPIVRTSFATPLLRMLSRVIPGRFGAGVCLGILFLYCRCLCALLDASARYPFLPFVIVNSAASFSLWTINFCNNTTGSRGMDMHWAGYTEKSAFTMISPFHFSIAFYCLLFCLCARCSGLGWAQISTSRSGFNCTEWSTRFRFGSFYTMSRMGWMTSRSKLVRLIPLHHYLINITAFH